MIAKIGWHISPAEQLMPTKFFKHFLSSIDFENFVEDHFQQQRTVRITAKHLERAHTTYTDSSYPQNLLCSLWFFVPLRKLKRSLKGRKFSLFLVRKEGRDPSGTARLKSNIHRTGFCWRSRLTFFKQEKADLDWYWRNGRFEVENDSKPIGNFATRNPESVERESILIIIVSQHAWIFPQ